MEETTTVKKKFYQKWWFWVIVVILVIGAFGGNNDDKETSKNVTITTEPTSTATAEPTTAPTEEPLEETDDIDIDTLVDMQLSILKENFSETGTVTANREDKIFYVVPTGDAFKNEILLVISGDPETIESWGIVSDSFKDLSASIYELTEYSIALSNPENTENILLLASNGIVLYDFVDNLN